jgi:nucleoside-diphosphate-sugar epimerase
MSGVLVTGGAGFIGSRVVRTLAGRGHDVRVLARPSTSLRRLSNVDAAVIHGDIGDPAGVIEALDGWRPDVCAHLAWYGDPKTYLTSHANLAELSASCAFLVHMLDAGCQRHLITGTCAEYAPSSEPLRENSPVGPATLYAASKLALQMVSSQLAAEFGACISWARIFHLYGPDENSQRLVPAAIHALRSGEEFAATAGDQVRDYLHVEDVATALCALIEHEVDGVVNVCSGVPVTVRHVIESIATILGRLDLVRFGRVTSRRWDPPFVCGDNSRLVSEASWRPTFDLKSGLEDTIAWWRSQPAR